MHCVVQGLSSYNEMQGQFQCQGTIDISQEFLFQAIYFLPLSPRIGLLEITLLYGSDRLSYFVHRLQSELMQLMVLPLLLLHLFMLGLCPTLITFLSFWVHLYPLHFHLYPVYFEQSIGIGRGVMPFIIYGIEYFHAYPYNILFI